MKNYFKKAIYPLSIIVSFFMAFSLFYNSNNLSVYAKSKELTAGKKNEGVPIIQYKDKLIFYSKSKKSIVIMKKLSVIRNIHINLSKYDGSFSYVKAYDKNNIYMLKNDTIYKLNLKSYHFSVYRKLSAPKKNYNELEHVVIDKSGVVWCAWDGYETENHDSYLVNSQGYKKRFDDIGYRISLGLDYNGNLVYIFPVNRYIYKYSLYRHYKGSFKKYALNSHGINTIDDFNISKDNKLYIIGCDMDDEGGRTAYYNKFKIKSNSISKISTQDLGDYGALLSDYCAVMDVKNNLWLLRNGSIYMSNGKKILKKYTTSKKFYYLSVYDDKNLAAFNDNGKYAIAK